MLFGDNPVLGGLVSFTKMKMFRPGMAAKMVIKQALRSMELILSGIDRYGFIAENQQISTAPARPGRVSELIEGNSAERLTLDLLAHVAG